MDANFFRFLAGELSTLLAGQRIEKIHGPAEGVLVLTLHGHGRKSNLIFRPAKSAGLFFLSNERPPNPFTAPARVMWLRKRLTGRKLLEARCDWANLTLAFALSPRDVPAAGKWLVLDLRQELTLAEDFPEPEQPTWPDLPRLLDDADVWRDFPQATPPLRRQLAALNRSSPPLAARLLANLSLGQPDGFYLCGDQPPLAWQPASTSGAIQRFDTALEASRAYGERALFAMLGKQDSAEAVSQAEQARRRLARQLTLLDKDEERHRHLAALAVQAEALQIALSDLAATPAAAFMVLDHPEHGPQRVPLNPRLTPAENMAHLFKQAAKGRRGLAHVERRRALLLAGTGGELRPQRSERSAPSMPFSTAPMLPKRYQGLAVACFRSSDGFMILRGKSSQANHDLLSRAASPHDYWLHAAGGPSSHVILRRDYPDQPVPEQTLLEAAGLCALKSYRKDDARAEVLLARVKDVRKVKGAAIGSVAVDQVERTLLVTLDAGLEKRLAL